MVKGTIDIDKVPSGNFIDDPGTYTVRIVEVDDSKFNEYGSVRVVFKCIDDNEHRDCLLTQYLTLDESKWKTRLTLEMMNAIGVMPHSDDGGAHYNTSLWMGGECIIKVECKDKEPGDRKYKNITAYYHSVKNDGSKHVSKAVDDIPF